MCFQAAHEVKIRSFEDACKQTITDSSYTVPIQVKTCLLEVKMSQAVLRIMALFHAVWLHFYISSRSKSRKGLEENNWG